ncbi:PIG-L family deacetylase [Sphingomonas parva]|uniref:PIG-L family deacetylase n=1 Tax=Sphingomonas parva TaxID=2555898 RepID=A0A4Y8ZMT3_9SPHN|nr:PIG-L family deacetylase [Sphingomonas parva]TFI57333.1 PIG-L family deacetylase [Sphingomonas parva]
MFVTLPYMHHALRTAARAALLILAVPAASAASAGDGPVLAAFAHPDDERVVGPLLARLAREGREVHLVIATDGSKGVTPHGGIAAGPQLAAARVTESQCAADRLGVRKLHMIGLEDGSLGHSMERLAELRTRLAAIVDAVRPEVVVTFGPEGGTGHPDHRLVGNVTTEIVQGDARRSGIRLFYASLPEERLRAAPQSVPRVSGVAEALLTVRVPVAPRDVAAGRASFACHATQYTPAQMDAINRTLAYVWDGTAWLRPWNGADPAPILP